MRVGAVARALVPSPRAAAREDPRVRARAPAHRHHPRPPRALPPSDAVADASAAALGAVAGAGLVALAWPIARRELRPIRCATCRGMSWTICDRCRGRGKTGCPPLVAAVDEYAAAAADADEPGSPPREGSAVAARPGGALVLPAVRRAGAGAVRAVRGDGRGEQLALRPGGEPGVGAQGGVERPGEAPAMETPEGRVTLERGTFI